MDITKKLASVLGYSGEEPNIQLAREIVETNDHDAVRQLVDNLTNKTKRIPQDCIKTLYEIGFLKPVLLTPHFDTLLKLLPTKVNRLQWGAMTAINTMTLEIPDKIYTHLGTILEIGENGSVITKDNCMQILIKLYTLEKYRSDVFTLINEQLKVSLPNQLPSYAEKLNEVIVSDHVQTFIDTLKSRLPDVETESKLKRVEKVIKKASQKL